MSKLTLDARVKFLAGPAAGSFGRVVAIDESAWAVDVKLDDSRIAKKVPAKHLEFVPEATITDRDKLVDRVRKLLDKAASAKELGNEAEAATFAAGAQKMMAKYKLELSEVEYAKLQRDEPVGDSRVAGVGKRKRELWVELLAAVVARAHYCRTLVYNHSDDILLVGTPTDRAVAEYVFTTLRDFGYRKSDLDARAFRRNLRKQVGATYGDNKHFRAAWLDAFVGRIAERYEAERTTLKLEAAKAGTSLVRLDQALTRVDDELVERKKRGGIGRARAASHRYSSNELGRAAGRAAGDAATIRGTGLGQGAPNNFKRLS
jgi:hypothetical protein